MLLRWGSQTTLGLGLGLPMKPVQVQVNQRNINIVQRRKQIWIFFLNNNNKAVILCGLGLCTDTLGTAQTRGAVPWESTTALVLGSRLG